ncbi:MAG: hypothetical protein KKH98_10445, partial [Spirochaetes bacterium]|nr:hypothetical protein [Spirochaetota bacterium]
MKYKFIIMILSLLLITGFLYSAGTFNWTLDNYLEFNKGKLIGVKLSEEGLLTLAPQFKKLEELDDMFIWDIKEDSKGNIYVATGNDGLIYKISSGGKIKPFFKTSSIAAFKLLIDKDDNIYASTITKGLIYKIDPNGKGTIFNTFDGDYIWDMKFYKGNILLATGAPGMLFELDLKTKKMTDLVLTKEMHITCLDVDDNNNIYFGTSDKGVVYKLTADKKLKVIYQTDQKEVHAIIYDKRSKKIYAGTSDKEFDFINVKQQDKLETPYKQETKGPNNLFDDLKDIKKLKLPANAVYEIKENESVNKIIESKDSTFLSLILDHDILYIGSGDSGNVYRYTENKIEKIAQMDEQQVLCFYRLKDGKILFGTGNIGNLYQLDPAYSDKGTFISDVFDAQGWAFWGKIQWDIKTPGSTDVNLQTRSGNVEDVDDTWSDWSDKYSNDQGTQIKSPAGRFIQFKLNLSSSDKKKTPEVYSVKIPYLIKNRQPEILSIKFSEKESDGQAKVNNKDKTYKKFDLKNFELKIQWEAKDEDKDSLAYSIYGKLRNEKNWIMIKKDLTDYKYVFDTRILPDGIYLFKVIADDLPSNSISSHLTDEMISKPFIIDNTPPKIKLDHSNQKGSMYLIKGEVLDEISSISAISYSVDTKKWVTVFPNDLIFDSKTEYFQFPYKYKEGIIIIKAEDD